MSLVDPRITKLAEILVDYSLKVQKGDNVFLHVDFVAKPLALELYKLLLKRGAGQIRFSWGDYEFSEAFMKNANEAQLKLFPQIALDEMKKMDCYIGIISPTNTRGLTGVDAKKLSERAKVVRPITNYRVENTRWVLASFPTNAQAQEADMSLEDYEKFVFDGVIKVDWKAKFKEQEKLRKLVDKTKKVRIVGLSTDLTMSIAGRKAVNAAGEFNMPDGEVFTSVIEDSTQGHIQYSYPALYMGREYHKIELEFKKGKVVKAKAEKGEKDLNKILDMDKGSRTIGELGLGNNYQIKKFTKDILYDEKMGGTIHLALGKGYKETLSKNESALHWDMIKDLRSGGQLWFDNKLVQKNGKWTF